MVTIQQVKAARALLDWKQTDLAEASGMSLPAIARLENGATSPRADTINAITQAFSNNGIEFNDEVGVSLRREVFRIEVFEGKAAMRRIWDDVSATFAPTGGGELLMSGMDERIWIKEYGDDLDAEVRRRFKAKIKSRLLIKEGDNLCVGSDDVYRCVPEAVFGQTPYFVYADKFALINWGPPAKIVLIQSKSVADNFRQQFEFNWKLGTPVQNPNVMYSVMDLVKERDAAAPKKNP